VVWAKRILAEQEAFKAEAAAVKSGITGTLRLGAQNPPRRRTLALPVAAVRAAHHCSGNGRLPGFDDGARVASCVNSNSMWRSLTSPQRTARACRVVPFV